MVDSEQNFQSDEFKQWNAFTDDKMYRPQSNQTKFTCMLKQTQTAVHSISQTQYHIFVRFLALNVMLTGR